VWCVLVSVCCGGGELCYQRSVVVSVSVSATTLDSLKWLRFTAAEVTVVCLACFCVLRDES